MNRRREILMFDGFVIPYSLPGSLRDVRQQRSLLVGAEMS
jgi:hypothetical protein